MYPNRRTYAALSLTTLLAACGGGGGGSTPPPPAPPPPPVNHAPTLTTTSVSATEDSAVSLQVAASDSDGNALSYTLSKNPLHGTATLSAAGALTYTPTANYSGSDSLDVTVSDGAGGQTTGTLSISVAAVDDLPVLATLQLSGTEDATLHAHLAGSDVEGDAFTFQYVSGAAHGNVTLAADGALTYTPDADFCGTEQLHVKLVESSGQSSPEATVTLAVAAVNDAPLAHDDALRVPITAGQPIVVPVLANDVDVDGDALVPEILTQPRGGTLSVDATTHQVTFAPANGYVGPIDFTYRVSDGHTMSSVAGARAVIGDFHSILFLSDYTTPGRAEVHVYDGLEIRRLSDDLPAGSTLTSFYWSGDLKTLVYVVDSSDAARVYVKPMDGSAPATLRYTSAAKSPPAGRSVSAYLNNDGTYLMVYDGWAGTAKLFFSVNVATGATTRVAADMPAILDVRFAIFHPTEPTLVMVQGQTGGNIPRDSTAAMTAYLGNAADMRTVEQIWHTYSPGEYGAGEGFYFGANPRYIYFAEYLHIGVNTVTNFIAYDRTAHGGFPIVRNAFPPDRGVNGTGWLSPDMTRLCFGMYEPTTTTYDGPSRFYAVNIDTPSSAMAATPVLDDITQCAMAADNRTMVYRVYTPEPVPVSQKAYAVDSVTPGTPQLLAPGGELNSEQSAWSPAPGAMRIAIAYFDYDGNPDNSAQVGRYYTLPLDGSGTPFLFSDTFRRNAVSYTTFFSDSNADGSFVLYGRPNGTIPALELMSTHGLNLSIPLSNGTETIGVRSAHWLEQYPYR